MNNNGVHIHKTAFVSDDVEIGLGTIVGPNTVILGPCKIGENCWIGPNVVIGTPAQDNSNMVRKRIPSYYFVEDLKGNGYLNEYLWNSPQGEGVIIGDNTIVREHSAIQQGTVRETYVGSNVFLMHKTHIGHDVYVGDYVNMAPSVVIAGHCSIFDRANLGMAVVVHQRKKIGSGAMVGMNSTVTKDIRPYELCYGSPAKVHGLNTRLMKNLNITDNEIKILSKFYKKGKNIPDFVVDYIDEMKEL
jgi:UDP-N-acetylglucosamine acyltransferase